MSNLEEASLGQRPADDYRRLEEGYSSAELADAGSDDGKTATEEKLDDSCPRRLSHYERDRKHHSITVVEQPDAEKSPSILCVEEAHKETIYVRATSREWPLSYSTSRSASRKMIAETQPISPDERSGQ